MGCHSQTERFQQLVDGNGISPGNLWRFNTLLSSTWAASQEIKSST